MSKKERTHNAAGLAFVLLTAASMIGVWSAPAAAGEEVVTQSMAGPFDKVVTALRKQIARHKLVVVQEVPYQKMLGMVGTKSEPMMGFEVFHPRYGKVLYETDVTAFKEAPLRIVVRATGNDVTVEYRKPSAVFAPYRGLGNLGKELDAAFADIVKQVSK